MYRMDMTGTKWEIFQAAINLFSKEGYYNVAISQIATSVGISASSIYNHFSGKDMILEQMYEFYNRYVNAFLPDLDELVAHIGERSARDTLVKAVFHFPTRELQDNMDKILSVAASMTGDIRAKMLIQNTFFKIPHQYFSTLLNAMIERDKIYPLDVEAFVTIFCCIAHSSAIQMMGLKPVSIEFYGRMTSLLFNCIREK